MFRKNEFWTNALSNRFVLEYNKVTLLLFYYNFYPIIVDFCDIDWLKTYV